MPYTGRLRFGLHDERDVFANVQYSRSFLLSLQYPYDPNARPHKCSGPAGNPTATAGPTTAGVTPTPGQTGAPGQTAAPSLVRSAAPAAVPQTGGAPTDRGTPWALLVTASGAALIIGSGALAVRIRRR